MTIENSGAQLLVSTGGATLDNLIVDDDITATGTSAGIDVVTTLTLKDNTQILGGGTGTITIGSSGQLLVTTATGATLDGVVVTDTNANAGGTTPGIDVASGAVLTLNDNTQIISTDSGTLQIENTGELLIAAGAGATSDGATAGGATLDGVIVTDKSAFLAGDVGGIEGSGATVTLKDGPQIKGGGAGTMTIENSGAQLLVSTGGATRDNLIVDDDITATGTR